MRTPLGEIDLIAARGDLIAFIEVKARDTLEGALEAISPRQRRRIYAAAEVWLAENPPLTPWNDMRFDVILVLPSGAIRHLENVDMST